ncbi:MAG: hypothetical protein JWR02_3019 [Mucilaginibacter sp.]|nr:hypothetical protein [Mucilaginibacter sp.]
METAVISQQTANAPLTGSVAYLPAHQQPGSFTPHTYAISIQPEVNNRSIFKVGADYALTAIEKALKLNLLGADINTEYLELTVRVYAGVFMLTAKRYVKQLSRKALVDKNILAGLFNKLPGHYSFKNLA